MPKTFSKTTGCIENFTHLKSFLWKKSKNENRELAKEYVRSLDDYSVKGDKMIERYPVMAIGITNVVYTNDGIKFIKIYDVDFHIPTRLVKIIANMLKCVVLKTKDGYLLIDLRPKKKVKLCGITIKGHDIRIADAFRISPKFLPPISNKMIILSPRPKVIHVYDYKDETISSFHKNVIEKLGNVRIEGDVIETKGEIRVYRTTL